MTTDFKYLFKRVIVILICTQIIHLPTVFSAKKQTKTTAHISSESLTQHFEPSAVDKPFIRVQMREDSFAAQTEKILTQLIPKIETYILELNLAAQLNFQLPKNSPCTQLRDKPGYDNKTGCLYIPKILFGSVTSNGFKDILNSFAYSFPAHIQPVNVQINEIELTNPTVICSFKVNNNLCQIQIAVQKFSISANIMITDRSDNNRVVYHNPIPQTLRLTPNSAASIELIAKINTSDSPNNMVEILENNLKINLNSDMIEAQLSSDKNYLQKQIFDYTEKAISSMSEITQANDYPANSSAQEKYKFAAKIGYSEAVLDKILNLMMTDMEFSSAKNLQLRSYMLTDIITSFVGETNFAPLFFDSLWNKASPLISSTLAPIIENSLPLNKEVQLDLSINTPNDDNNIRRHIEITKQLDQEISQLKTLIESHQDNKSLIKNIEEWQNRFDDWDSAIYAIGQARSDFILDSQSTKNHMTMTTVLESLAQKLRQTQTHITNTFNLKISNDLDPQSKKSHKEFNKMENIIIKMTKLTKSLLSAKNKIIDKQKSSEKKLLFKINKITQAVTESSIDLLFGGAMEGVAATRNTTYFDKNPLKNNEQHEVVAQIPVDIVNSYLKLLHKNNFFDICNTKKKVNGSLCHADCLELGLLGTRQSLIFTEAPQIIQNTNDQYQLVMPNIKRKAVLLVDFPLLNRTVSDNFSAKVQLNNRSLKEGPLFGEEDITLTSSIKNKFQPEAIILTLMFPWQSVLVTGLGKILSHTFLQETLLQANRDRVSGLANSQLSANEIIKIKKIEFAGGGMTVYGSIESKNLSRQDQLVCPTPK